MILQPDQNIEEGKIEVNFTYRNKVIPRNIII